MREAVEIARAPVVLNSKEEYNRCLLPRMTLEGPKAIRVQELEEHQGGQVDVLTQEHEEQALMGAKKKLRPS